MGKARARRANRAFFKLPFYSAFPGPNGGSSKGSFGSGGVVGVVESLMRCLTRRKTAYSPVSWSKPWHRFPAA